MIQASIPDDEEKDALLLSCRYGDLEDVQAFVGRHGLPDIRDENQNTVLHMASANGHLGMELVTRLRAEPKELIVERYMLDVLKYLLPLVPPSLLSAQNSAGSTALHWAAVNAHLEVAKALVETPGGAGIDLIDVKNAAGHSPLAEAEFAGWDEGAKWFVQVMNLDIDQDGDQERDPGSAMDGREVEVEIEDAEGQVARMKLGGYDSSKSSSSSSTA